MPALTLVGIVTPIITVPTATGTTIKAWSDRAEDAPPRPRANRPRVVGGRRARRRLLPAARPGAEPELQQETGRVLGGFATVESSRSGSSGAPRFFSLMMLTLGLVAAAAVAGSPRFCAPGAGYT